MAYSVLLILALAVPAEAPADPLDGLLAPMMAGSERTAYKRLTPQAFVQNERKDPYHARVYVECGLEAVADAQYGAERVTLLELRSPLAALCAMGNDKTLDGNPIDSYAGPQSEAFRQPGALFLRQGRYFVRIRGSQQNFGGGPKAAALLKSIAFALPNPKSPDPAIEALRELPNQSRIPGSDRYLSNGVLGYQALGSGYSAEYACGDTALTIINIASEYPAKAMLTKLIDEAMKRAQTVEPYMFGDESVTIKPALNGPSRTYALRVGDLLAVVDAEGSVEECGYLMEELTKLLRQRQARADN